MPRPSGKPRPQSQPKAPRERKDLSRVGGLPAVRALFATAPERIERLFFLKEMRGEVDDLCRVLAQARKPYREVGAEELAKVAGSILHGGVVAIALQRPTSTFDAAQAREVAQAIPLLLCLDGVANPHNLGAIIRTAAFFGLDRIVLSDHPGQAGPSDAAHRVAEGGMEHVSLSRAQFFPQALKQLKPTYRVIGTALDRGRPLDELKPEGPVALVLGNEEFGMSPQALAACDDVVRIEGSGRIQSLNVAATAAILIHALAKRKTPPAPTR
ncbi:MAG: RNA methyltransferase [Alphaproteobacteria bacterium]|nr:RNA methyltransferase [Alphaproteobacteria bacterium]